MLPDRPPRQPNPELITTLEGGRRKELRQTRWQALLFRLYWREPTTTTEVCGACNGSGGTRCGIHWESPVPCTLCGCGGSGVVQVNERRPRRFAWLLRPLMGFEPLEG